MPKANILFYSLALMLIIMIVTIIMTVLFHGQIETLIRGKEGGNAFSAAQAGIERARNRFAEKFSTTTCNGIRQVGTVAESFITYGPTADTSYSVSYWFICTGTTAPFILNSYEITSIGTFRGATRTITAIRP